MNAALKAHTSIVIDEYLSVARHCVDVNRGNGAVWGYPAAILLFSAIDAIGRGILPERPGNDARLEVLLGAPFNLRFSDGQIALLRRVYRNTLAHNAQLGRGAVLTAERTGEPFEFQPFELVLIRLPVLCHLVQCGWAASRAVFNPPDGDRHPGPVIHFAAPAAPVVSSSRQSSYVALTGHRNVE